MKIIANLFRDTDETNDGLSPAVEEVARAVMCRKARDEGHRPTNGHAMIAMGHRDHSGFDDLRRRRIAMLLRQLTYAPMTRVECLELLGMSDGPYWTRIMQTLREDRLVTITKASNRTTLTITPAGRAHAAHKVAAE